MDGTSGNKNSDNVYKFIFENSLDAILLTSPDGSILAANPAAEALFGYSQDELCQLGRSGIVDIKDPQLPILLEERRRKGKVKGELTFIRKNGGKFPGFISSHIFKDENGHERTSMTIIDLTEIKNAEMALKESEERYHYLFDTIGQGIVYQDSTGKITSANIAAQKILGLSLDQMRGRKSTDPRWKSIREDGSDFPGEKHPAMVALKTGQKIENVVMGVYDPQREEQRWIKINAIPQFKNNEKLPYQVYTTFEDITNRKETLEALQKSEERYSITLDAVNDGLWDWDVSSGDAFFSPNYYKLLGYDPGEFPANYESWRLLVHPQDIDSVEEQLEESVKSGIGFEIDLRMKTKSEKWLWVSTRGKAIEIDLKGNATRMVGTLSDITERKEMELELKKSLEEKEMLLKEIHHRVKNNLMVISSLLNLQSRYIKDKDALGIFKESQSRARSMALIHERLYQSSDLKRINFGEYIRTLAIEIFHTYAADDGRLKLKMDVDDLMLDINTTVPLGLILNELVSNCMKHAFTQNMNGEIKIDFHKNGEKYLLRVLDNGKGFPENLDFRNTQSLGLQIVNSLTEQIDGKVDLDRSQGTLFTVTFQEKKYD